MIAAPNARLTSISDAGYTDDYDLAETSGTQRLVGGWIAVRYEARIANRRGATGSSRVTEHTLEVPSSLLETISVGSLVTVDQRGAAATYRVDAVDQALTLEVAGAEHAITLGLTPL